MGTREYFDDLNKAIEEVRLKHGRKGKSCNTTYLGATQGKGKVKIAYLNQEKCFINLEKKKLSEPSQTKKELHGLRYCRLRGLKNVS
ncbi:hypothetical protein B1NLA3E_07445 [Bacillus sp. 1NLA3E]|nr:hypothetical protein B1NLA3E_07445 [Bacillus sp. 1NLA3E]